MALRILLTLWLLHPTAALAARWAVVVGVSGYEDPAIPHVPHAQADAEAVRDWLSTVGGVPPDHLWLLKDGGVQTLAAATGGKPLAATRSNLLEVLTQAIAPRASEDDTVFVYFAGQSTTTPRARPTLLLGDARLALPRDTGVTVQRILDSVPGTPMLWLDTSPTGRGSALPTAAPADAYDSVPARGMLWAATAPNRVAEESTRAPHGAFTDALLRALRSSDGSVQRTWVQLTQSLRRSPPPWGRSDLPDDARFADLDAAVRSHPRVVSQAGHGSAVTAVAWHPSRPWAASSDATGIVQVVDVERREIRLRFPSGRRGVHQLAFSDDGELLFAVGADGVARAWTTADGALAWDRSLSRFEAITAVAAHDDQVVIGTAKGRLATLQRSTGKRQATWRIGPGRSTFRNTRAEAVAWSPSGEALATAAENGELSVWWTRGSQRTGKRMRRQPLRRQGEALFTVAWTRPGTVYTGGADGIVRAYDLEQGTSAELPSNGFSVHALAAHPTRDTVAIAADEVRLWSAPDDTARTLVRLDQRTTALTWSSSGAFLLTGHSDGQLRLWNAETGEELGTLSSEPSAIEHVAVGPRGQLAVVGYAGATVWDLSRGRPLAHLAGNDGIVHDAAFSPSGALVLGASDGTVRWWDPVADEVVRTWSTDAAVVALDLDADRVVVGSAARIQVLSPDGTLQDTWTTPGVVDDVALCGEPGAVVVVADGKARVHEVLGGARRSSTRGAQRAVCDPTREAVALARSGGTLGLFEAESLTRRTSLATQSVLRDPAGTLLGARRLSAMAFAPAGDLLLAGAEGATTRVWDLERRRVRLDLDTYGSRAVAFVPEGELAVTGGAEGTVRMWDLQTGTHLATAVTLGDDWLVWTPEGLFDGSPAGQRTLFRWRIDETLHPPSRFNRGYYRPGLLAELARGERPRPQRSIASLSPPPRVRIVTPTHQAKVDQGFVEVGVRIDDQGGGISEPRLYLNGHRVADTRGIEAVSGTQSDDAPDVTFRVALMEGENHLRATAFNEDGTWEALGDEIRVDWAAPVTEAPRLHVLAVGIDAYRNRRLALNFARDDAEAIAGFFDEGLFREVVPHTLVDDRATLEGIRDALATIAEQASPRDALLVYLAGHGVMSGEVFHFLPWDVEVGSDEDVQRTGLSQAELGVALAEIPAAKQLVVLDACHSGGAMQGLAQALASRSSPGLIRAQQRLADSTGAFLIAASTEAQVANEIPELGHGVLTYAILDALGRDGPPAANRDLDGNVTVSSVIQYVSQVVPRLTDRYHRQRQEVVQSAAGQDFPLVAP